MRKNNKFGFTLVELLAVIAVLALILIIAVPKITKTLDNSKNRTLELSAKSLARSAEEAYLEKETYGLDEEITCESIANINSDDYLYCNISFNEEGEASVTIIGKGQYEGKYICQGSKTESSAANEECNGGIPSDILEERHKFYYYSSMVKAVNDVNNNQIGVNQDATKEIAVAGVYTYNNKNYVVLLKDSKETERLRLSVDMIINLAGNILSSDETTAIDILSGNVIIDGTIEGSGIIQEKNDSSAVCVQIPKSNTNNSTLKVNSGNYTAISHLEKGIAIAFNLTSSTVKSEITNSNIKAYSNLFHNGSEFVAYSIGIRNANILSVNNCNIRGNHSAIQNKGTMYVDGGVYESYNLGGIYFTTEKKGNTAYIRNATLREVPMPDGYTTNRVGYGSGFYVFSSTESNISVYMDNCDIFGSKNQIIMGGYPENTNNKLYMSNSRIYDLDSDNTISIDVGIVNGLNKLYIGKGNNFTKENTNLPELVIETNEVYVKKE